MEELFGARLRRIREALGEDQAGLAARAEVSQPTVARWERGSRSPSLASLERLARALGVDPGYLLTGRRTAAKGAR